MRSISSLQTCTSSRSISILQNSIEPKCLHQRVAITQTPLFLLRSSSRRHNSSTTTATVATGSSSQQQQIIRPLVPPPDARSGPLLTRRPDRALPNVESSSRTWLRTIPIFLALITVSSLAIFNYQKSSSSTVNSILYALRTNPQVRDLLGDEIYFASKIPWISGELNQLHGNIDISFWVRGTKGIAQTKFVSVRPRRDGFFETIEWSLATPDGRTLQLLELEGARDPMAEVVKE